MSVDRVWIWQCNTCTKKVNREEYGLPKGWLFLKAKVITHACDLCSQYVPKEQRGIPQVTASK